MQKFRLSQASWKGAVPILLFLTVVVALIVLLILTGRDPVVTNVSPTVVAPGDRLTITGRHFGDSPGTLRLAGDEVPPSSVAAWSEEEIVLSVPQAADSGLIFVVTDSGSSDGDLIRMESSVPRSAAASFVPGAPQIVSLGETDVQIGEILVITGHNFGTQRRASRVLFPASTDSGYSAPEPADVSYPSWTDKEIRVRVPSGAESGFVYVDTAWGGSNPMRLLVERPAGQLVRTGRSEIAVRYGASVSEVRLSEEPSEVPGSTDVVVWLPRVASSLEQSNIRYLESDANIHAVVGRDGIETIRFEDVGEMFASGAVRTVVADRFGLQLEINPSRVSPAYEAESGFFEFYTRSTSAIPASDERFEPIAATVRRSRSSPYQIALAAYDWILSYLDYGLYSDSRDAIAGYDRGYGDDYTYATLYVTVLRAARIPSRVVGGVLISDGGHAYPHFWAEFFVPALGWLPADPSLGDRAFPAGFPEPENPAEFYFGNLDSSRLAFHHGFARNGPDRRDGVHIAPEDPYSGQDYYAEAGEMIKSLTVGWFPPRLVAVREW